MMAEILETISNARVKVEYDDPYSGSPFFSENSLSAKIEKSPTLIHNQEGNQSPKKDTLESGNASMASSVQELQETNSVTSDTRSEEPTAIDNSHSSGQVIPEEFEEVCYENVSSNLPTSKNKELSPSRESAGEGEILSDSFCELDSAIYDAPWDLGALQKGLEEKFKLNEQSSQDDLHAFDTSQKPPPLSVSAPRTSLPTVLAFHGKNSPELVEKFPKHGSNTRQSAKGRSPSRKTDPNSTFDPCDPRQVLQKRPLPAFPTPQSTPTSSFKSNNFPSSSLVSVNDRQHFQHPLQRRGVPVMGGGSVGRGHQLKPSATQASDWRPLEDYDSPWDNRQKDLMSTFSQASVEPSSLMGSMKNIAQHQFSSLAERIESRLPLEQEWWYHGPITRQDAEKRLKNEREGSYLIRNSESNRLDYSLSIKSSNGCIHLKIVPNSEGRFILGQFSQPFASVAQMIQHYTVNKLPIKGAEHMSLTFPVGH